MAYVRMINDDELPSAPPVVGELRDIDDLAADMIDLEETIIETVTDDVEARKKDE